MRVSVKRRMQMLFAAVFVCAALTPGFRADATEAPPPEEFVITDGVLTGYNGPGGDVTIPESVTAIADSAFAGNTSITNVTVPASVQSIGSSEIGRAHV